MKLQMSEEKETADSPTVIIKATEMDSSSKGKKTKKIVLAVVGGTVLVAIILIAILVGMYMFTESQKEILKYSLKLNKDTKQDVTSDPNTNIVEYHVNSGSFEAWIYNDFNRDIQVVKLKTSSRTNCYSSPLNRTTARDPSAMTIPSDADVNQMKNKTVNYKVSDTPIPDTSFLSKTVTDACKGISTYWAYPSCEQQNGTNQRQKRGYWIGCCYYWYSWGTWWYICYC